MAPLLGGYLAFGQYWGVWVVVLIDFLNANHLSIGRLGLQLAALSVVSILTMTLLAPRLQSLPLSVTIPLALAAMGLGAFLVAVLPQQWIVVAFAVLGVGNGLIDVFLNVAAQGVEMRTRKPTLQRLHAFYSIGGITGALGAGIASVVGVSYRVCLVAASLCLMAAAAWNLFAVGVRAQPRTARGDTKVSVTVLFRTRSLIAPALVVLFAFFVEGSMDIWSVTYLRRTLEATALVGGISFAVFSASMAVGRLSAGRILFGLGYRRTIQVSGVGALLAGVAATITSSSVVAGIAFLFLGFFIASAAPAAFGLVGGSGESPTLAIAAMTTVGYAGFVVGPPIMGWLAQTAGLRATMALIAVATIGVAAGGMIGTGSSPEAGLSGDDPAED